MSTETPQNKSSKINIALIVSLCSLLISGLNFYYSNYRIKNKLEAKIADYTLKTNTATGLVDTFLVRISFINKGNRSCSVIQPWYELADSNMYVSNTSILLSKAAFPNIFTPSETGYLVFRIPFSDIRSRVDTAGKPNSKYNCYCRIKLSALDFNFSTHTAYSEFFVRIEFSRNEILRVYNIAKPVDKLPVIEVI